MKHAHFSRLPLRTGARLAALCAVLALTACASGNHPTDNNPALSRGSYMGIGNTSGSVQVYGNVDASVGTTRYQGPGGSSTSTGLR